MKRLPSIVTYPLFLLSLVSCNSGAGSMKAGPVNTKTIYGAGNQDPGETITTPSPSAPNSPVVQKPSTPQITTDKIDSGTEEGVLAPSPITGALLYCAVDKMDRNEAISLCNLRDSTTKKVINPTTYYKDIKWTVAVPSGVTVVEVKDLLPSKSYWQVSYSLRGSHDGFRDAMPQIVYKMSGTRIADNVPVKIEDKISSMTRPNFYLQSQYAHGAEALRCLDFSFDTDADRKGTTGACRPINGQRMNFNADGTIGLIFPTANQCMTYDPGNATNQYVVPKACNAAGLPRPIIVWEVNGQEMRLRGSNLCLSRTPDQPDPANDYIGVQVCNGSTGQRWEIINF